MSLRLLREIADGKVVMGIRLSTYGEDRRSELEKSLKELEYYGLVCYSEEEVLGKVYKLTGRGVKVLDAMKD